MGRGCAGWRIERDLGPVAVEEAAARLVYKIAYTSAKTRPSRTKSFIAAAIGASLGKCLAQKNVIPPGPVVPWQGRHRQAKGTAFAFDRIVERAVEKGDAGRDIVGDGVDAKALVFIRLGGASETGTARALRRCSQKSSRLSLASCM